METNLSKIKWKKENKLLLRQLKQAKKTKNEFDFTGDILLNNVSYTYSKGTPFEDRALDYTNLKIKNHKITCVIGTTGSGKSTLIQLMNGLITPQTGSVIVGDYPIPAKIKKMYKVKELRKQVGLVFQFPEYQLFQDTVEKDVSFGPISLGEEKVKAINEVPKWLELVGLPREFLLRSPFELSGGQKRRVAIAGILAMNGSTLILDEPTGGLDPQGEEDFMNLFKTLHDQENKRIIMISHNMDQVLRLADEVIVMKDGKVVKHGTPFAVFSNQKLIDEMGLEPPKIYSLLYRLKEAGIDLTNQEIRNLDDFASAFVKYKKTAQAAKKRQQNAKKGTVKKTVTTSVKKTKRKEG